MSCLNHELRGEERLLSVRFSFNAGTLNQGINGMDTFKYSSGMNCIKTSRHPLGNRTINVNVKVEYRN